MNPRQRKTKKHSANRPGLTALSHAEIEQVAGGNSMPLVAKHGDLVYVGPKEPDAVDLAEHLGLNVRKPDYLYRRP